MTQEVTVMNPRIGLPNGEAAYLATLAKGVFDAVGSHPTVFLTNSPARGVKATVDDGDNSQNTANALAQAMFDAGGPTTGYTARKVDTNGAHTVLTPPTPS